MTDLEALASQVEVLTGPDREVDCAIGVAIGKFFLLPDRNFGPRYGRLADDGSESHPGQAGDMLVPKYTESLDAAVASVPKTVVDFGFTRDASRADKWRAHCYFEKSLKLYFHSSGAATPALALTAAALRARAKAYAHD